MGRLEGRVCVITGASGGIGSATAKLWKSEGAIVAGADVAEGADFHVDVSDEDQVRELYAAVRERHGRIDVLFNNAGISPNADASVAWIELHGLVLRTEPQPGSVFGTAIRVTHRRFIYATTQSITHRAARWPNLDDPGHCTVTGGAEIGWIAPVLA